MIRLLILLLLATPAIARVSEPGRYEGWAEARFDGFVRESRYVPAPDGTKLAIDVYRPANGNVAARGRFPVIFNFTPYRRTWIDEKGNPRSDSLAIRDGMDSRSLTELVRYGYVVAVADVRGKGASFGTRAAPNDRVEAKDGAALVNWIAAQDWSDGKVGIFGCSYHGGTAWGIVAEAPKAVKAAMIGCTALDKYEDFGGRGGIKISQLTDTTIEQDLATAPVEGHENQLKAAVEQHRANGDVGPLLAQIPYRDDSAPGIGAFWEDSSIHRFLPAINKSGIAIYLQGGWDDHSRRATLLSFANLTGPRKLLIGPWQHCRMDGFDYVAEAHRFFDYWLKGVDNGVMAEPAVTWFARTAAGEDVRHGIGEWRTAKSWPLPEQQTQTLWLGGDRDARALPNNGTLAGTPGTGSDSFAVVKNILTYSVGRGMARPTVAGAYRDARGLTYTGAPASRPLTLAGHPVVRLWISSPDTEADVFAYLSDVAPDGKITTISEGRLRASHRALAKAPYDTAGLPWHSGNRADARPLVPEEPSLLEFEMVPLSWRVAPGHSLRLTIVGDNATGAGMPPATRPARALTVYRDAAHPSRLELPVLP